ncbi:hypothetical protein OROHE_021654 [Orobanche hederae]
MAGKTQKETLIYEEFIPRCNWYVRKKGVLIEIRLPGFTKEHISLKQIELGVLVIFGERQLDASRKIRFETQLNVRNNKYDTHEILSQAIFDAQNKN